MINRAMEKTWTIVKFIGEDDVVEAVPSTWIKHNTCLWPSHMSQDRLKSALKFHEHPDEKSWTVCLVNFFRNGIYDNYHLARNKANKAQLTSDLESDYGDSQKRKRTKKIISSSDDDSDLGSIKGQRSSLPKPPQASKIIFPVQSRGRIVVEAAVHKITTTESNTQENTTSAMDEQEKTENAGQDCAQLTVMDDCYSPSITLNRTLLDRSGRSFSRCSTPSNTPLSGSDTLIGRNTLSYVSSHRNQDIVAETTETNTSCTCCPKHKDNEYIKQVIRKQNILQGMISQVLEDIAALKIAQPIVSQDNFVSIFTIFNLPVADHTDLIQLEDYLKDPINFQATVVEVSKIGGKTTYEHVRRTLCQFLTDDLASQYSWLGAKKKKIFHHLKLADIIIESALQNKIANTKKEVEEAIKNWLRRAKERAESKVKNKKSNL